ncbi:MAG: hypothetical protein JW731_06490 [Bacteroidales bacterium]|nr:hypothetical protein [Bacteroidales bacterium]
MLIFLTLSCAKEEQDTTPTVTDPRDIITGDWLCTETIVGEQEPQVYEVVVRNNPSDKTGILMDNFALTSGEVRATLDSNQVNIPLQTVNMIKIEGSGVIHNENSSQWQYTVVFQGITEQCSAVFETNKK